MRYILVVVMVLFAACAMDKPAQRGNNTATAGSKGVVDPCATFEALVYEWPQWGCHNIGTGQKFRCVDFDFGFDPATATCLILCTADNRERLFGQDDTASFWGKYYPPGQVLLDTKGGMAVCEPPLE